MGYTMCDVVLKLACVPFQKAFLALSLSATSSHGADGHEVEPEVPGGGGICTASPITGRGSPGSEKEPL